VVTSIPQNIDQYHAHFGIRYGVDETLVLTVTTQQGFRGSLMIRRGIRNACGLKGDLQFWHSEDPWGIMNSAANVEFSDSQRQ